MDGFVTTSDLDAYLSGDKDAALAAATAAMRSYCRWHVAPEVTEVLTVDVESDVILLPSLHVTEVSSVTVDGDVLDADRYEWSTAGVVKARGRCFPRGFRKAQVKLTHGYAEAPEVAAIVMAAAARSAENPSGISRTQVGQISETYSQAGRDPAVGGVFNALELAVLDRYRLPSRP